MKKIFTLIAAMSLTLASVQGALAEGFEAGTHYSNIVPAQIPADLAKDKVEVIEFFWYGCPHCYDFEPYVNKWLAQKPKNVVFKRIPAIFNKGWVIHAKAYYTAEMLGITDKVHPAIFNAIHKRKQALDTSVAIVDLMASASGLDKQVIADTLNSFAVETKSRQAIQAARLSGLRGVPAVTVNGKYLTSARQAGDYPGMIKVVDYLVAQESQ